ncbi:hypothetical protein [Caenimonas sp. SL110]|uniref:hypothetical protein n=1 Tax=Caenimonas sp. SL110 TaxID=1450524 RepID=UPI000654ACDD|nr:hypothetical protein [Caenimonas sp. SL110]
MSFRVLLAGLIWLACLSHLSAFGQAQVLDVSDLPKSNRNGEVISAIPGADKANGTTPRYTIPQDRAETGSNIRRSVVTSALPLNKKYEELSPSEKELVRSQYVKLGPRDEPPFPMNGLATVYKAISVAQGVLQVKGNLSMFVDVNSKGEPMGVSVFDSPDPQITRAVASILMLEKYKPAVCDGSPCQMGFPVRLGFELR